MFRFSPCTCHPFIFAFLPVPHICMYDSTCSTFCHMPCLGFADLRVTMEGNFSHVHFFPLDVIERHPIKVGEGRVPHLHCGAQATSNGKIGLSVRLNASSMDREVEFELDSRTGETPWHQEKAQQFLGASKPSSPCTRFHRAGTAVRNARPRKVQHARVYTKKR